MTLLSDKSQDGPTRRDFLVYASTAAGVAAAGFGLHALSSSSSRQGGETTDVDLSSLRPGQAITVTWRGQPVFIRYRSAAEISAARAVPLADLKDPQSDEQRVKRAEWLILVGVCTHEGCIPLGQKPSDPRGDYGGWFCPCHGSVYDSSGRVRRGPALANLAIPPYRFISDSLVRIGSREAL